MAAKKKTTRKSNSQKVKTIDGRTVEVMGDSAVASLKEAVDATQKALEEQTLKAVTDRGVIESDNDWFENWKSEDHDILKGEEAYLQAYGNYLVAKRSLEQARKKLRDIYQNAGLSPMNIISHRLHD
jgi:hypothetical protein